MKTAVLLLIAAGILGCNHAPAPPPLPEPTTVRALGRLEPAGGVRAISVPLGDRVRQVLVEEGERVQEGQQLALLESYPDRQAELALVQSQRDEARARLAAITANGTKQLEEAAVRIQQLRDLRPFDSALLAEKVKLAEEQAKITFARLVHLKALDLIPGHDIMQQELLVAQAHTDLAVARTLEEKARKAYTLDLQAAQLQRDVLEKTLDRASKEIPLQSLEASVRLAEERLERTTVRAPSAGVILKIVTRPGEVVGVQPLLRMGDTRNMLAIAEVYETDCQRLRPGQRAFIRSKALPASETAPLTGVVEHIGSMVARNALLDVNPAEDADRRVIEVKIRLDDSTVASRYVNLQVHVSIALAEPGAP